MILIGDDGVAQLQSKCIEQPGKYAQLASAEDGSLLQIEQELPHLTDTISGMTFDEIVSKIASASQAQ